MSTDSQGRPLSDDGQWAWSGTEWVPASGGGATPGAPVSEQSSPPEDMGATMIAPSPFAGGTPSAGGQPPYGTTPQPPPGGTPGYAGSTPPEFGAAAQPAYGAAGATPGYGATSTTPKKSRGPLVAIILVLAAVIIAAVVVTLIFTLGGDDKKTPSGAFTCTSPGSTGTGTIKFTSDSDYTLDSGGKGGKYTISGDVVSFSSGSLAKSTGVYDSGAKTVKITFSGQTLNCKQ